MNLASARPSQPVEPPAEVPVMVRIGGLRFRYPRSSFRLVIDSLQVARGERLAVVGPSGSGKTTFLNLISGIVVPEEGHLQVAGQNLAALGDAARRDFRISTVGAVFQQFELLEYLTVGENILLPYLINPALELTSEVRRRVAMLAEQTGIDDKLSRRVNQLSQGEQQRVAICRAILPSPQLILADEPTGNLDPANKRRILELLFQQCRAQELTLIAVTHDHNILEGFDRTVDFSLFHREAV